MLFAARRVVQQAISNNEKYKTKAHPYNVFETVGKTIGDRFEDDGVKEPVSHAAVYVLSPVSM
jgi:hypothetical protein